MREQIRKLEVQSRFSSISMKKRIPERLEEEARSEEITKEITQEKFPEWRDLILRLKDPTVFPEQMMRTDLNKVHHPDISEHLE